MPHERFVQVSPEEAETCEGFVDALLLLPLALDRTCSYVRYSCSYGGLCVSAGTVKALAECGRALRAMMEQVEQYCLQKGCTVVTPDRARVDTVLFRKFVRHAVPMLLQCTLYMCALYDLLRVCAHVCRSTGGLCSLFAHWRDARKLQQQHVRRIHAGLRAARRVTVLTHRLGCAAACAVRTHPLADHLQRVTDVIGAAVQALQ